MHRNLSWKPLSRMPKCDCSIDGATSYREPTTPFWPTTSPGSNSKLDAPPHIILHSQILVFRRDCFTLKEDFAFPSKSVLWYHATTIQWASSKPNQLWPAGRLSFEVHTHTHTHARTERKRERESSQKQKCSLSSLLPSPCLRWKASTAFQAITCRVATVRLEHYY